MSTILLTFSFHRQRQMRRQAAHVYAVENEIPFELIGTMEKDENTGISVTYSKGTFDGDVSVKFEEKNAESLKLSEKYEKALVYDISFSLNGKEVQPNGKVTVKLPIPADYDTKSLKVYHEKSDGSLEEVEFKVVNGYVVFEASSFSNYILIDTSSVLKADYTLGDVDGNGSISAADARLALRASVGLENYKKSSKEFLAADVDKNGKITAADARLILRVSVGLEKLA